MMIYSVQKTIVEAVLSVVVALMGHFINNPCNAKGGVSLSQNPLRVLKRTNVIHVVRH